MRNLRGFLIETATTAPKRNAGNGFGLRIFAIIVMVALALRAGNAIPRYVVYATTSGISRGIAPWMKTPLNLRE